MSEAIPNHWQYRSLNSLGEYKNGFAFSELHWSEHGLPIVRIAQITGSQGIVDRYPGRLPDTFRIDNDDLIFSWSGTLAVVRWTSGPAWLNQHLFKVVPTDGIKSSLLFHLLQASVAEMGKRTHGSTMKHIKRGELREFFVLLPIDENEQEKIAEILDTLDIAIQETEAIITKLKAVKQGLLYDLLTRGIDANGELRPPQTEVPHLYKQSPLGCIPRDWKESIVAQEFLIDSGITLGPHRAPRYHVYPYLRVANVYRARIKLDDIAWLEASSKEAASKMLRVGDLLLVEGHASTDEIGRCALATTAVEGMLFQNHLFRLRPLALHPEFSLLWLNSSFARSYWRNEAATSSGLNTINRTKLQRLDVAVPSPTEQEMIVASAFSMDARLNAEEQNLKKLRKQKSGLMDDLLTGRVRVTPLLLDDTPA